MMMVVVVVVVSSTRLVQENKARKQSFRCILYVAMYAGRWGQQHALHWTSIPGSCTKEEEESEEGKSIWLLDRDMPVLKYVWRHASLFIVIPIVRNDHCPLPQLRCWSN
jgi:hypothetical protein